MRTLVPTVVAALSLVVGSCFHDDAAPPDRAAGGRSVSAGFARARSSLLAWTGPVSGEHEELRRILSFARSEADPNSEECFIEMDGDAVIYVASIYSSVAVCLLGGDGEVVEVWSGMAKCGYTLEAGPIVVLHEHPGTDMFYNTAVRVEVKESRLVIEDIEVPLWPESGVVVDPESASGQPNGDRANPESGRATGR